MYLSLSLSLYIYIYIYPSLSLFLSPRGASGKMFSLSHVYINLHVYTCVHKSTCPYTDLLPNIWVNNSTDIYIISVYTSRFVRVILVQGPC